MPQHPIEKVIAAADKAINRMDFDTVATYYTDDAVLIVRPGEQVQGRPAIRDAFKRISRYFNDGVSVSQGEMQVIETLDTALVLSKTYVHSAEKTTSQHPAEREATYIFRKEQDGCWRCAIDNSYGNQLLS